MQTALLEQYRQSPSGQEAEAILRSCVHCGFCNAACPTYQLLGDELDGPRGRIYLIKQALEGGALSQRTRTHLDRCLTCLACETTCPSGVDYRRLLEHGRAIVESRVPRTLPARLVRSALRRIVPHPRRFAPFARFGRWLRPVLPAALARRIPEYRSPGRWPRMRHARRMLLLAGCVQPVLAPGIDAAAARACGALGISLIPAGGCCGALSHHLSATGEARMFARRNIDAWWPHIEAGAEAIVVTASGCAVQVKDYGNLLGDDPRYADKAARVARLARDLGEILAREHLERLQVEPGRRVAFHAPCTLQHGQRLHGAVEAVLTRLGFTLTPVPDAHLCCGSAGAYSILQGELSQRLLTNKVAALESAAPTLIATANIGCLLHLATRATVPVRHWIELLDSGQVQQETTG